MTNHQVCHYIEVDDVSVGGFDLPSTPPVGSTVFISYRASMGDDRYTQDALDHFKKWNGVTVKVLSVHYDATHRGDGYVRLVCEKVKP